MARPAPISRDQVRKRRIGAIHAAAHKLGIEDDARRAMQLRVGGHASAKDMSLLQLSAVLIELKRLEGKAEHQARGFDVHQDEPADLTTRPMLGKVGALLADGRKPWRYAHAMAKRMFHTARVEWLRDDQLHKLVAALEVAARRERSRKP